MSTPLKKRLVLLEAKLAAEIEAHKKTFEHYRDVSCELVILKLRNQAALAALDGDDYFEGEK